MEKHILIASSTFDEHAYAPVTEILEHRGYPVVIYKTDKLLSGEDQFTIDLTQSNTPSISYNGTSILPEDISAAWYRKVGSFSLSDADQQLAKQLYMNNEVRALHDTIWPQFYPDDIWLSPPANIARADRKLGQLMMAHEVGFSVPKTVVSSNWGDISTKLLTPDDPQMIIKMMRGVISDGNQLKSMHTTVVDQHEVDRLEGYTSPFPGLYQPFVEKAREWRVTVVGNDVFPVAIYTGEDAKDDWRKHQNTDSVRFESEAMPEGIDQLCIRYLGKMGLKFGAFDLIEKSDGEVVFLECNPNGQYGWLEESLDLPISDAIASELVKIAES
jgi:hypothetical protein